MASSNFLGARGGPKRSAKKVQAIPERKSGRFSKRALTYSKRDCVCQSVFIANKPMLGAMSLVVFKLIAEISA